jgi:hypothetical protein
MPTVCHVISDYGYTVKEIPITDKITEFNVSSDTARYFYLRLIDSRGNKTWSMPVWCGREFDNQSEQRYESIPMNNFVAIDQKGADVSTVIDENPLNEWFSDCSRPEITIDMKENREISALGYYPRQIYRKAEKPNWKSLDETPSLVAEFEIYTSIDGEKFELVNHTVVQQHAEETIAAFPTHKARFIKFRVIDNLGTASKRPNYRDFKTVIGNISLFKLAQ